MTHCHAQHIFYLNRIRIVLVGRIASDHNEFTDFCLAAVVADANDLGFKSACRESGLRPLSMKCEPAKGVVAILGSKH